jgi:putative transposase
MRRISKIKGKWSYLYRAIDTEGHTLDIWLRKQRDNHSAYAFIKRLIKQFGKPQKGSYRSGTFNEGSNG